jgi:hypothetical protein
MAIAGDIIVGIVGAIGIIFGFGILKMQRGGHGWPMLFTTLFSHY